MLFTKATTVMVTFGTHGGVERFAYITRGHKLCALPVENHGFKILLYQIFSSSGMLKAR